MSPSDLPVELLREIIDRLARFLSHSFGRLSSCDFGTPAIVIHLQELVLVDDGILLVD